MKKNTRPAVVTPLEWRALQKQGKVAGIARSAPIVRGEDGSVSFIASTATADRYGDTIDQAGWMTDAYEKNPVLLWAHSYSTPPVGKVGALDKSGDLKATACEFTPAEMHPFGAQVGAMVKAGFLNTVSVGFLPLEWEERYDEGGRFLGYHFKRMELLEISVVPVPANPQALLEGKSFAKSLADWTAQPDESSFLARTLQAEVAGFIKAAEDLQTRADDAADEGAFAGMLALLKAIEANTRRHAEATEALVKVLKIATPAPADDVEVGPVDQAIDLPTDVLRFLAQPLPVVPEAPTGEDASDSPLAAALLLRTEG